MQEKDIQILQKLEGAKKAEGLTVVIDVFRAFSFEAYAFSQGADSIIPVSTYEEAMEYKRLHSEYLVAGESEGKKLDGFDFGNSPSEIESIDLTGRTLVHRSSAGIQGLLAAKNAEEIITGSLVNADAVVEYIKSKNPKKVSLVCCGLMGTAETEEDTLCAEYIKTRLLGRSHLDMDKKTNGLKYTSGAKFFDPTQQEVFPQKDFELCIKLSSIDVVLKAIETYGKIKIFKVK